MLRESLNWIAGWAAIVVLALSLASTLGIAATVTVDYTRPTGSGVYQTLSAALNAYPSWHNNTNDTVYIVDSATNPHEPGGTFSMPATTSPLTIKNATGDSPVIVCKGAGNLFMHHNGTYLWDGLTFIGTAGVSAAVGGSLMVLYPDTGTANVTLQNCVFTANAGGNVPVTDWASGHRDTGGFYYICWLVGPGGYGTDPPFANPHILTVKNSVLANSVHYGYGAIHSRCKFQNGSSITVENTLIVNSGDSGISFRRGVGCTSAYGYRVPVTVRNSAIINSRLSCIAFWYHPVLDNLFRHVDLTLENSIFKNRSDSSWNVVMVDPSATYSRGNITVTNCTFYDSNGNDIFAFNNIDSFSPPGQTKPFNVTLGDSIFNVQAPGLVWRSNPSDKLAMYNNANLYNCAVREQGQVTNCTVPYWTSRWNGMYGGSGPLSDDPMFIMSEIGSWINGARKWDSSTNTFMDVCSPALTGKRSDGGDLNGGAQRGLCLDLPTDCNSGFDSYVPGLLQTAEAACVVPAVSAEWGQMKQEIMEGLQRTLGKDLPRTWPALNPTTHGSVSRQGYSIQQVSAEFWPGVRYAMEAYVPDGTPPFPGVVMACTGGYGPREVLYQVLGGGLARMGILVVGVLPLGKGVQTVAYQYNGIALLAGTSIAQEQFHTGQRGLDYLLSRPDVDPTRVGITGDSDGGWVTLYVGAYDARLLAVAPASTNYTFTGLLLPDLWKTFYHAEGNAPEVLTYRANIPTLAAAAVPKWYNFLNAQGETSRLQFIPIIDGEAHKAYTHAGVPERYMSSLSDCGHGYWPIMQVEAISWFCQVFFEQRPPVGTIRVTSDVYPLDPRFNKLEVNGETIEPIDPSLLQVDSLPDDGGGPAFLQIIETRRQDAAAARAALASNPNAVRQELSRCLGIDQLGMNPTAQVQGNLVTLETEPGLDVCGYWVTTASNPAEPVALVVGAWGDRQDPGLAAGARFDLLMREESQLGQTLWALLMLNRPPVGMWVWDAMAAAHWLKQEGFETVEIIGAGDVGSLIALMAGALSQDVSNVRIDQQAMESLDQDVVQTQVADTRYWAHRLLWVTDIPELTALLESEGRLEGGESSIPMFRMY